MSKLLNPFLKVQAGKSIGADASNWQKKRISHPDGIITTEAFHPYGIMTPEAFHWTGWAGRPTQTHTDRPIYFDRIT